MGATLPPPHSRLAAHPYDPSSSNVQAFRTGFAPPSIAWGAKAYKLNLPRDGSFPGSLAMSFCELGKKLKVQY